MTESQWKVRIVNILCLADRKKKKVTPYFAGLNSDLESKLTTTNVVLSQSSYLTTLSHTTASRLLCAQRGSMAGNWNSQLENLESLFSWTNIKSSDNPRKDLYIRKKIGYPQHIQAVFKVQYFLRPGTTCHKQRSNPGCEPCMAAVHGGSIR